jgi:para-nitrobenzyl esterase
MFLGMPSTESRVLPTTGGLVRGAVVADGVVACRGIPYAAAPRGAGRFAAPGPAPQWAGVRDALEFGPMPVQPPGRLPGFASWEPDGEGNPLTVNVWGPAAAGAPRPVLLWIYGGAYTVGGADFYLPYELARAGLVVVTFNYRVGFAGFGHLPGAPDNRGLLDQLAALRWTRANIAHFGGDPSRITVAGQSAGAGSAAALMVLPAAAGLFQRVIAHSVPSEYFSTRLAASIGQQVADSTGAGYNVASFAGLSDAAILGAQAAVLERFRKDPASGARHYLPTIYSPVVGSPGPGGAAASGPADGDTAPALPGELLTVGPLQAPAAAPDVALLAMHTVDEFRTFSVGEDGPAEYTEGDVAALGQAFGLSAAGFAQYRAAAAGLPPAEVYAMLGTDFLFGEYTTRLAEARGRAGAETYLARFAWPSPAADGAFGACHGADLPFGFGDLQDGPAVRLVFGEATPTRSDEALARRMLAAWVAFAYGADPGWPPVTASQTPVRIWDHADRLAVEQPSPRRAAWAGVDFGVQRG